MPLGESIAQLYVKLGLDTTDVEQGAKKAQTTFDDLGRKLAGALSIATLVQFGRTALDAFGDAERAITKVQSGLESMGRQGVWTLDELTGKARDLARTSIFDDDAILEGITSQLVTFGNIGTDSFDRAQQAAVDLASKMGIDLAQAAQIVGRALESPADASRQLRTANIILTEAQRETIKALQEGGDMAGAQALVFELLEAKVGGAGEAMAATSQGGIAQMQNAMGDLMEVVGEVVADVVVPLATGLTALARGLQDADGPARTFAVGLGLVAAAVGAVWLAFGPIGAAIVGISTALALLYSNWDEVVFFMESSWLQFKIVFLEAASMILGGIESFVNGALELVRPLAKWIGVDVPASVSIGSAALHDAASQAVRDLGELQARHRSAESAAAAMAAETQQAAAAVRDLGNAAAEQPARMAPWIGSLEKVQTRGLDPLITTSLAIPTTLDGVTSDLESTTLPAMESAISTSTGRMNRSFGEIGSAIRTDLTNALTGSLGPALDGLVPGFARVRGFFDELPALSMAINTAISEMMGSLLDYLVQVAAKILGIQTTTAAINATMGVSGSAGGAVSGGAATAIGGVLGLAAAGGVLVGVLGDLMGLWSLTGGGPSPAEIAAIIAGGGMLGPGGGGLPGGTTMDDVEDALGGLDWSYANGGVGFGAQGRSQQVNVYLDGRMIGQVAAENMPDVLNIYGAA